MIYYLIVHNGYQNSISNSNIITTFTNILIYYILLDIEIIYTSNFKEYVELRDILPDDQLILYNIYDLLKKPINAKDEYEKNNMVINLNREVAKLNKLNEFSNNFSNIINKYISAIVLIHFEKQFESIKQYMKNIDSNTLNAEADATTIINNAISKALMRFELLKGYIDYVNSLETQFGGKNNYFYKYLKYKYKYINYINKK